MSYLPFSGADLPDPARFWARFCRRRPHRSPSRAARSDFVIPRFPDKFGIHRQSPFWSFQKCHIFRFSFQFCPLIRSEDRLSRTILEFTLEFPPKNVISLALSPPFLEQVMAEFGIQFCQFFDLRDKTRKSSGPNRIPNPSGTHSRGVRDLFRFRRACPSKSVGPFFRILPARIPKTAMTCSAARRALPHGGRKSGKESATWEVPKVPDFRSFPPFSLPPRGGGSFPGLSRNNKKMLFS